MGDARVHNEWSDTAVVAHTFLGARRSATASGGNTSNRPKLALQRAGSMTHYTNIQRVSFLAKNHPLTDSLEIWKLEKSTTTRVAPLSTTRAHGTSS